MNNVYSGIALIGIGVIMVILNRNKIKGTDPENGINIRLFGLGTGLIILGLWLVVKYGFLLP